MILSLLMKNPLRENFPSYKVKSTSSFDTQNLNFTSLLLTIGTIQSKVSSLTCLRVYKLFARVKKNFLPLIYIIVHKYRALLCYNVRVYSTMVDYSIGIKQTSLTSRSSSLAGVTSPSSAVTGFVPMFRSFGLRGECDLKEDIRGYTILKIRV